MAARHLQRCKNGEGACWPTQCSGKNSRRVGLLSLEVCHRKGQLWLSWLELSEQKKIKQPGRFPLQESLEQRLMNSLREKLFFYRVPRSTINHTPAQLCTMNETVGMMLGSMLRLPNIKTKHWTLGLMALSLMSPTPFHFQLGVHLTSPNNGAYPTAVAAILAKCYTHRVAHTHSGILEGSTSRKH